jgi:hypothetical protein
VFLEESMVSVFQRMPVKDVILWTGLLNGYMEFGLVDIVNISLN